MVVVVVEFVVSRSGLDIFLSTTFKLLKFLEKPQVPPF